MVKVGGRTAWRVSDDLFKNTDIAKDRGIDIGKTPIKDYLCSNQCAVFCGLRKDVIMELIKKRPDLTSTAVREQLTDLKTVTDILDGGKCICECEDIKDLVRGVSD